MSWRRTASIEVVKPQIGHVAEPRLTVPSTPGRPFGLLTSPKISVFPVWRSELPAGSGKFLKNGAISAGAARFWQSKAGVLAGVGYTTYLLIRYLVLDAPIGCSSRQNFTLGTSYRSLWYSVDCQRVLLQAGAIRRRYSQVAKKSLSQSL